MLTTLLAAPIVAQALPGALITWALIFFVVAIIAYLLGARGVAGMSAGVGRTLLFVFLVLAVLFVIISLVQRA